MKIVPVEAVAHVKRKKRRKSSMRGKKVKEIRNIIRKSGAHSTPKLKAKDGSIRNTGYRKLYKDLKKECKKNE